MTQPKTGQSSTRLLQAGAMAIVAAALFAAMSMSVKALEQLDAAELPVLEVTFFRYVFGLLTASPLMIAQGRSVFHTRAVGAHATRVFAGIGGVASMFAALTTLPLGFVTAISFSNPFFALIFATLFLGERAGPWRWLAVVLGFSGVIVMAGAPLSALEPMVALAVLAAVFFGVEVVMIRRLALTEDFATVLLYNNLGAIVLLALPVLAFWQTPTPEQLFFLAMTGVVGVLGQMLFLTAMRIGEASFVAPFLYLTLVFAMIYGFFLFDEVPTSTTLLGSAIITSAGLFMLYREHLAKARQDQTTKEIEQ
ncbi:MAG: DMT family transporter [Pseudomonadota bacterium]